MYYRMSDDLQHLPHPSIEWRFRETRLDIGTLQKLRAEDLIECVRHHGNSHAIVWQTTDEAWDKVVDIAEKYDYELTNRDELDDDVDDRFEGGANGRVAGDGE